MSHFQMEMQEQLEELLPIKDLVMTTQQKLRETEQLHSVALESVERLTDQLTKAQEEVSFFGTFINPY